MKASDALFKLGIISAAERDEAAGITAPAPVQAARMETKKEREAREAKEKEEKKRKKMAAMIANKDKPAAAKDKTAAKDKKSAKDDKAAASAASSSQAAPAAADAAAANTPAAAPPAAAAAKPAPARAKKASKPVVISDSERARALAEERAKNEEAERAFATAYECQSVHRPINKETIVYPVRGAEELEAARRAREAAIEEAAAAKAEKARADEAQRAVSKAGCQIHFSDWELLAMVARVPQPNAVAVS